MRAKDTAWVLQTNTKLLFERRQQRRVAYGACTLDEVNGKRIQRADAISTCLHYINRLKHMYAFSTFGTVGAHPSSYGRRRNRAGREMHVHVQNTRAGDRETGQSVCTACGACAAVLPRCSDCGLARYCSVECQGRDFYIHRHVCSDMHRIAGVHRSLRGKEVCATATIDLARPQNLNEGLRFLTVFNKSLLLHLPDEDKDGAQTFGNRHVSCKLLCEGMPVKYACLLTVCPQGETPGTHNLNLYILFSVGKAEHIALSQTPAFTADETVLANTAVSVYYTVEHVITTMQKAMTLCTLLAPAHVPTDQVADTLENDTLLDDDNCAIAQMEPVDLSSSSSSSSSSTTPSRPPSKPSSSS